MELSRMSMGIIKIINKSYNEYIDEECLDIIQIKNICNLYKVNPVAQNKSGTNTQNSVTLSEINFSSPEFKKVSNVKNKKKQADILKSNEFIKKYSFFIRILYACLKIEIDIFDINNNIVTLKNNFQLLKAIEVRKKRLIADHIAVLKNQYKNISQKIDTDYENYCNNNLTKIKIIDKIMGSINKLIKSGILDKTDNFLTLILPYFYTYTEFIEEYN